MFKEIGGINDLINSEGFKLRLKERTDLDIAELDLYIEGTVKNQSDSSILSKVNPHALKMYLDGRLRTKELFLLRSDEPYYIIRSNHPDQPIKEEVNYGTQVEEMVNNLDFGNYYYTDISWRTYKDTDVVMRIINLFW